MKCQNIYDPKTDRDHDGGDELPSEMISIRVLLRGHGMTRTRFDVWRGRVAAINAGGDAAAAKSGGTWGIHGGARATTAGGGRISGGITIATWNDDEYDNRSGDDGHDAGKEVVVLVISRRYAPPNPIDPPNKVLRAATIAFRKKFFMRTDKWLERCFVSGDWDEGLGFDASDDRFLLGRGRVCDAAGWMKRFLGNISAGVDTNGDKKAEEDAVNPLGGFSVNDEGNPEGKALKIEEVIELSDENEHGPDVVTILSDSDDDGEENHAIRCNVVAPTAYFDQSTSGAAANRLHRSKAVGVRTGVGICARHVTKLQPFRARWLRGVSGKKEAKTKAFTTSTSKQERERRLVLEACRSLLAERNRRGMTYRYEFEKCHERATERHNPCRGKEKADGQPVDTSPTVRAAATGEDEEKVEARVRALEEAGQMRSRNREIATRIRSLVSADAAWEELCLVRSGKTEKTSERSKNAQQYRERQYDKVACIVENYPIPVTCASLAPLSDHERKKRKSGLGVIASSEDDITERLGWIAAESCAATQTTAVTLHGASKIVCNRSTRRRLIRSILHYDRHALLRMDGGHARDEKLLSDPDIRAVNELRQIWGVGAPTAAKLACWGVHSVEELRRDAVVWDALNPQQRVGVTRFEDLQQRIPREEVAELYNFVSGVVQEVAGGRVTVTAGGSYRRGRSSCGDVDFILLPNKLWMPPQQKSTTNDNVDTSSHASASIGAPDDAAIGAMSAVLAELRRRNFLTDDLTTPNMFGENDGPDPGTDSLTYMGVCKLPGRNRLHRRVDIKAYPGCQGAFALLYFTGDAHFNRSLRAFAKRAGLTLSDAGLARCERNAKGEKMRVYESVRCESEEDVFAAMGLPYVAPMDRGTGGAKGPLLLSGSTTSTAGIASTARTRLASCRRWDDARLDEGSDDEFSDGE